MIIFLTVQCGNLREQFVNDQLALFIANGNIIRNACSKILLKRAL